MVHRDDIDGLRAFAVIAVVFFHARVPGFGGGFTGVDVFFVISGYLIAGIVWRGMEREDFSFARFYARRFARLLPALLIVSAVTLIASFFLLLPNEFLAAAEAGGFVSVFLSNYLFLRQANDYWSQNELATQPFLHTWSLAIEEQFYLVLPVLMLGAAACARKARSPLPVALLVGVAVVASFGASVYLTATSQAAAFYSLATRAWELFVGVLLAMVSGRYGWHLGRRASELAGWLGLGLLGWGVLGLSQDTQFPGVAALLPTLGAALIILAAGSGESPPSLVTRVLSARPVIAVGLASYSLYLWHWPILTLVASAGWYAYGLPSIPKIWLLVAIIALSLTSYKWVERPLRRKANDASAQSVIMVGLVALACLAAMSQVFVSIASRSEPVAQPLPPMVRQLVADLKEPPGMECEGSKDVAAVHNDGGGCLIGKPGGAVTYAVVGDSHARMWARGLGSVSDQVGRTGLLMARSGCVPMVGIERPKRDDCPQLVEASLSYVARVQSIRTVVLAGYWIRQADWMYKGLTPHARGERGLAQFEQGLEKAIVTLAAAGKHVVVMRDVPELAGKGYAYESAMASIKNQGAAIYGVSRREHDERQSRFTRILSKLQERHGFDVLDPADWICGEECVAAQAGKAFYYDQNHLTDAAALYFRAVWKPIVSSP